MLDEAETSHVRFSRFYSEWCAHTRREQVDQMLRPALILLLALLATPTAFGQTACPSGVAPGSPQCGSDAGTSRGAPPPPRPTGEWIKTWGAIVGTDSGAGGWPSTGKLSKHDAEQDALDQCRAEGVAGCKVLISYHNQCIAVAAPSSGKGENGLSTANTIELAAESAMKNCRDGANRSCTVIYKNCTKPVFNKY